MMSIKGHNPNTHDVYKVSPPYMLKEQKFTNSEKLKGEIFFFFFISKKLRDIIHYNIYETKNLIRLAYHILTF